MARSQQWYDNLSPSKRRRVKGPHGELGGARRSRHPDRVLRAADGFARVSGSVLLAVGLLLIAVIVVWQVRVIINSPFPRVQAVQAILAGIPLLLCVSLPATTWSG